MHKSSVGQECGLPKYLTAGRLEQYIVMAQTLLVSHHTRFSLHPLDVPKHMFSHLHCSTQEEHDQLHSRLFPQQDKKFSPCGPLNAVEELTSCSFLVVMLALTYQYIIYIY